MSLALEPQRLTGNNLRIRTPRPSRFLADWSWLRHWGASGALFRLSIWRAFEHDAFGTAKASAYSSIFTFFPALLVLGSVLATLSRGEVYLREISYAIGYHLARGQFHRACLPERQHRPSRGPAHHHFAIDRLERFRRHHFVDGRFSPCLSTAQDLGNRPGARHCGFAGFDGGHTADFLHRSGCFRQPH